MDINQFHKEAVRKVSQMGTREIVFMLREKAAKLREQGATLKDVIEVLGPEAEEYGIIHKGVPPHIPGQMVEFTKK